MSLSKQQNIKKIRKKLDLLDNNAFKFNKEKNKLVNKILKNKV